MGDDLLVASRGDLRAHARAECFRAFGVGIGDSEKANGGVLRGEAGAVRADASGAHDGDT